MSEAVFSPQPPRPRSLARIAWFGLPIILAVLALILARYDAPYLEHILKKKDFTNYWVASKLILDGRGLELFRGQEVYFAALREYAGSDINWHNWSYPPHYLFVILPWGLLGYLPAAALFLSVTLALFLYAVSTAGGGWKLSVLLLLLPAIICNIGFMQNGFLTSALLIYGLSLRQTRPLIAGIAIGMMTIKPQLGFLLPILLVFERRWTVIFSAASTAVLMIGLTLFVWGREAWTGYLTINLPYQKDVLLYLYGLFTYMMPSTYGSLRVISVEPGPAMQLHCLVAILALIAYIYCLIRTNSNQARAAATVFATFMISPYSLIYDLGSLTAIAALTVAAAIDAGVTGKSGGLFRLFPLLFVCILPLLTVTFAIADFPISPLVIAAAWLCAMAVAVPQKIDVPFAAG